MEANDELMTSGCPQCALKHLRAAIAHAVEHNVVPTGVRPSVGIYVTLARAYVNFAESANGYPSHAEYAAGLLVTAEESATEEGAPDVAAMIREIRLALDTPELGLYDVMRRLRSVARPWLVYAHWWETFRELPMLTAAGFDKWELDPGMGQASIDTMLEMIRWVKNEFFQCPGEQPEKGGEEDMTKTTKKAPAKAAAKAPAKAAAKAPAKAAVKAACKGGKAACKGKCKK